MGNTIDTTNLCLVGGFNSANINKLEIDSFKKEFEIFDFKKKLFDKNPEEEVEKVEDNLAFFRLNSKLEIFCRDYNLNTLGIYISKEKFGVMVIAMESAKMNLVIMDLLLIFLTNHFGFKFILNEVGVN